MPKLIDPNRRPPLSTFEPNRWHSESPEGTCVETNTIATGEWAGWVGVRDSKDAGGGPVLMFTEAEWTVALNGHVRRTQA